MNTTAGRFFWNDVMIDVAAEQRVAAASFWAAALGWPLGKPWSGHPEFVSFLPDAGDAYVHLQTIGAPIPPGNVGPARTHLDLTVADPVAEARRLGALGATVGTATADWHTMTSPGGMPFCLCPRSQEKVRPAAVRQPNGLRTRPMQVCVDAPAELFETEVDFWRQATGWPFRPSDSPEFAGKLTAEEGLPVQLLLQRLEPAAPETQTRAHLDLGADDPAAEATRLEALGAELIGPGDGWIAFRDPTGMPFCVTGNSPD